MLLKPWQYHPGKCVTSWVVNHSQVRTFDLPAQWGSLVPSLSAPQIFIADSMKNRGVFHTVSDKNLRRGKAGYEASNGVQIRKSIYVVFDKVLGFASAFIHSHLAGIHRAAAFGVDVPMLDY